MAQRYNTFEEYLDKQCFETYTGIKDNYEEYQNWWYAELEQHELIKFADEYAELCVIDVQMEQQKKEELELAHHSK